MLIADNETRFFLKVKRYEVYSHGAQQVYLSGRDRLREGKLILANILQIISVVYQNVKQKRRKE